MKNLTISYPLVDGSSMPYDIESGQELIEAIMGDDFRPPPRGMSIEAVHDDGRVVTIWIPNTKADSVLVKIQSSDGEDI